MAAYNSIKSGESLSLDSELDDSFCDNDDFDLKPKSRIQRGKNKKQKDKGSTSDRVDCNRIKSSKAVTVKSLPIPDQSKEILSKLYDDHQLKEIVSVLNVGDRSVSVHARMNIKHELYRDLESSNVFIKIFTLENCEGPDIEAAKECNPRLSCVCKKLKAPPKKYQRILEPRYDKFVYSKPLTIHRIDNIVIMKMIGGEYPAENLIDKMFNNTHYHHSYYDYENDFSFNEILWFIKSFLEKDYTHQSGLWSPKHILWHNDHWMIIIKQPAEANNSQDVERRNLMSIITMFHDFGVEKEEMKASLEENFNDEQKYDELLAYALEIVEKLE